ncbi:MAG: hypothetical protein AABW72_01985 [archaeon]
MEMKGFMFSLDAIVAVSAILILFSTLAYASSVNDKHTLLFADMNSLDASTVGLYLGENGYASNADEFACNSYVSYSTGNLETKEFCGGLG